MGPQVTQGRLSELPDLSVAKKLLAQLDQAAKRKLREVVEKRAEGDLEAVLAQVEEAFCKGFKQFKPGIGPKHEVFNGFQLFGAVYSSEIEVQLRFSGLKCGVPSLQQLSEGVAERNDCFGRCEVADTYLTGGLLSPQQIEVMRLEAKQQARRQKLQQKARALAPFFDPFGPFHLASSWSWACFGPRKRR